MATTRHVSSTDGVSVALHHLGGTGRPLLICHATGFHGRAYQPLADGLAAEHSVWALDMRGHGASTAPASGNFAWRGMGDDVLAAIDEVDTTPLLAVGHSLGGAAILLAELARPGIIEAAYMFEPIVFDPAYIDARQENPMAGPARHRRPEFESRQAALERYGSRPPLGLLHPDALAAYVEHGFVDTAEGNVRLACEPEHEARTFEAEDKMTYDRVSGLALRSLIARGAPEPGRMSPADFAAGAAAAIDGAELRDYPDLGHFGPLQDPARIAADIVDFFA